LERRLDGAMVREDQVRGGAHAELARGGHAARLELRDLVAESRGIDHHAVADEAAAAGVQDAGGHEVKDEGLAAMDDAVAGVGAALVAGDELGALGERIDDLALPFISPL